MGHKDLKKIDAGIISLKEKGATKAGMICGIIGTFFTTFILIIVIGIAVAVGISLFNSSAVQANRDAVVIDCMNIQSMAMQYYRKPATLGGGNNSFIGFEISNGLKETANGNYSIENINDNTLTIIGVGKETGRDGSNPVKVIIRVNGDNSSVVPNIIN
jgi:hypothetical protein